MSAKDWRVRTKVTEPAYRVTEGAALAWARTTANREQVTAHVDHRTDGEWKPCHTLQPAETA